jgi:hypothetical protein
MAVLIEGLSVVIRRSAIDGRFQGGWDAFLAQLPQATLCDDGEIARVGFIDSDDCEAFVRALVDAGLDHADEVNGMARDLAVVDQLAGVTLSCEWLESGVVELVEGGPRVAACRLVGSAGRELVTPRDWTYEGSLSERYGLPAG